MFIKRGGDDGKIIGVHDETVLDEDQKKAVKKMSENLIKQSENELDASKKKLES